jgi:hypothetical protein
MTFATRLRPRDDAPHKHPHITKTLQGGPHRRRTLVYAGVAIGLDGPVAVALLPLALIVIQTQVIAREERYLEAKFGDEYRRYKAKVRRWL